MAVNIRKLRKRFKILYGTIRRSYGVFKDKAKSTPPSSTLHLNVLRYVKTEHTYPIPIYPDATTDNIEEAFVRKRHSKTHCTQTLDSYSNQSHSASQTPSTACLTPQDAHTSKKRPQKRVELISQDQKWRGSLDEWESDTETTTKPIPSLEERRQRIAKYTHIYKTLHNPHLHIGSKRCLKRNPIPVHRQASSKIKQSNIPRYSPMTGKTHKIASSMLKTTKTTLYDTPLNTGDKCSNGSTPDFYNGQISRPHDHGEGSQTNVDTTHGKNKQNGEIRKTMHSNVRLMYTSVKYRERDRPSKASTETSTGKIIDKMIKKSTKINNAISTNLPPKAMPTNLNKVSIGPGFGDQCSSQNRSQSLSSIFEDSHYTRCNEGYSSERNSFEDACLSTFCDNMSSSCGVMKTAHSFCEERNRKSNRKYKQGNTTSYQNNKDKQHAAHTARRGNDRSSTRASQVSFSESVCDKSNGDHEMFSNNQERWSSYSILKEPRKSFSRLSSSSKASDLDCGLCWDCNNSISRCSNASSQNSPRSRSNNELTVVAAIVTILLGTLFVSITKMTIYGVTIEDVAFSTICLISFGVWLGFVIWKIRDFQN